MVAGPGSLVVTNSVLLSACPQPTTNAPHFSLIAQVQRAQAVGSEMRLQSHLCDLGQVL